MTTVLLWLAYAFLVAVLVRVGWISARALHRANEVLAKIVLMHQVQMEMNRDIIVSHSELRAVIDEAQRLLGTEA